MATKTTVAAPQTLWLLKTAKQRPLLLPSTRRHLLTTSSTTTKPTMRPITCQNQCLARPQIVSPQKSLLTLTHLQVKPTGRLYSSTPTRLDDATSLPPSTVSITYIEADGTSKTVEAQVGMDLMTVAHENNVELEGACGGELACSTCHLIFEQDMYDTLDEKEEEEDDMLDLAFEVTETSRLGCQIRVRDDMAGMTVRIPDDGF